MDLWSCNIPRSWWISCACCKFFIVIATDELRSELCRNSLLAWTSWSVVLSASRVWQIFAADLNSVWSAGISPLCIPFITCKRMSILLAKTFNELIITLFLFSYREDPCEGSDFIISSIAIFSTSELSIRYEDAINDCLPSTTARVNTLKGIESMSALTVLWNCRSIGLAQNLLTIECNKKWSFVTESLKMYHPNNS